MVKHYPAGRGKTVHSVDGVSLGVRRGEVLGLVGESGCGKSTLARTILRAVTLDSGSVVFDGEDISRVKGKRLKKLRSSMQFVFQDPYGAFDPKMRLGTSLDAPLRHHGMSDKAERADRVAEMLDRVGLETDILDRLPRECSGGQLQRLVIARALLLKPTFLICDEPTSALDASIRAQILNLLVELKDQLDLTLVLISHDLRVVRYLCDRVAVMYLGQIVEIAPREELFTNPRHPYTPGAAGRLTGRGERVRRDHHPAQGRTAQPDRPPVRVPFPSPLPAGPGHLPDHRAPHRAGRPGPPHQLPLLGRAAQHRRSPDPSCLEHQMVDLIEPLDEGPGRCGTGRVSRA